MKITSFEDLECWKQARLVVKNVYAIAKRDRFSSDYRLRDQITGAAISIMTNIAEGFASQSNREFIRFLTYSRRSASEVQSCLYVALDQKYITDKEFNQIYDECVKGRQLIDGFLRYLRKYQKAEKS
ncbi:MAG: four helix bundle protein [Planctomycetes bacterium]|nr:four helix bundle protein [Planctomycetota bacterium]